MKQYKATRYGTETYHTEQLTKFWADVEQKLDEARWPKGKHFSTLAGKHFRPTTFFRLAHNVLRSLRVEHALHGNGRAVFSDDDGRLIGMIEDVPIERRLQLYYDVNMLVDHYSANIESEVPRSVWVASRDGFCNFMLSMTHDEAVGLLRLHELAD